MIEGQSNALDEIENVLGLLKSDDLYHLSPHIHLKWE